MATFTDAFTRADSTNIASGAPVAWDEADFANFNETEWKIVSNTLRLDADYFATAIAGDVGSPSAFATCTVTGLTGGAVSPYTAYGPIVRGNAGNTQGYWACAFSDRIRLYQGAGAAVPTLVVDFLIALTGTHTIRIEAELAVVKVFVDGTLRITQDITTFGNYTGQYVGVGGQGAVGGAAYIDLFDSGPIGELHTVALVAFETSVTQDAFAETHERRFDIVVGTSVATDDFAIASSSTRNGQAIDFATGPVDAFAVGVEHRWIIAVAEYFTSFVDAGALPLKPEGGVLVSAVRVLGPDGRAVYSTLDESDAVKLPLEVKEIVDRLDGIVTRSASLETVLPAAAGVLPEHAPSAANHPLRSWSGSMVEIYVGWQVHTSEYRYDNFLARRATLTVGRSTWKLDSVGHRISVPLVDMRDLLDDDFDAVYTVASGANVATTLQSIVQNRFDSDVEITTTGTTAVLPAMSVEAGTSRLDLIRTIENATGWMVSFDQFGRCVIGPQVEVLVRAAPRFSFGTDFPVGAPVENLFTQGAPSGASVKVSSMADKDDELTVTVWDSDPSSPTYWVPGKTASLMKPTVQSVTSEAVTDERTGKIAAWSALRRYGRGGGDSFAFDTVPIPQMFAGDAASVAIPAMGANDWFVVEEVSLPLRPGPMRVVMRPSWDPTSGGGEI